MILKFAVVAGAMLVVHAKRHSPRASLASLDLWVRALVERDADPLFTAPDRAAMAHELIGLYDERESLGHADRVGDIYSRTIGGNVPHRAVQPAAAAESERAAFEHSVSGYCPFLDHRCESEYLGSFSVQNDRAKLRVIESNICGI